MQPPLSLCEDVLSVDLTPGQTKRPFDAALSWEAASASLPSLCTSPVQKEEEEERAGLKGCGFTQEPFAYQ